MSESRPYVPPEHRPGLEEISNPRENAPGASIETPAEIRERGSVSNEAIRQKLAEVGLAFEGKREILSGGFFGIIYLLEAKRPDGTVVQVVEKTFTTDKKAGKRYSLYSTEPNPNMNNSSLNINARLRVMDAKTGEARSHVIDWLYNEEKALRDLEGIPGIPKSFGAVYEGLRGSILEEFVDGFDLSFCDETLSTREEINAVFDRFRDTYVACAERGYVFPEPGGATVMVSKETHQPMLIDWYNHSSGSIEAEGPVRSQYELGLTKLETRRGWMIQAFEERMRSAA